MTLPHVFIGSSGEGKEAVAALHKVLTGESIDAIYWKDHPAFSAGVDTLSALVKAANSADFGIFVIRADDVVVSRSKESAVVRDNVLFEYGLFLGVLGQDRVFAVYEEGDSKRSVKIPSDLLGVGMPRFRGESQTSLAATARAALNHGILSQIKSLGRRERRIDLRGDWKFDKKKSTFIVTVDAVRLRDNQDYLKGRTLAVVARRGNPRVAMTDDSEVVISELCKVPRDAAELVLSVTDRRFTKKPVTTDDVVEGYILAVPPKMSRKELVASKTVEEMIRGGCDRCGGAGVSILG